MANFSGSFISDTYQRVLQLDTTLQDGTGSLLQDLPVTASHAISASYAISASVEILKEISSSNADTASLALSGDGHFSGSFTGSFIGTLTGVAATASYVEYTGIANKPTLLSSSAQIADDISGSFTLTSSSLASDITSHSASAATDIAALVVDSGSFSIRVTSQELFSSSLDNTFATEAELNAATSSLSGSLATDIASLVTDSGSFNTRITNLGNVTGSYATTGSNQFSGNIIISSSQVLTLEPVPTLPTGQATGSIVISGSEENLALYVFAGTGSFGDGYLKIAGSLA